MRFRNTLILGLLVAALGAYLWLVERPAVEKEAEKATLLDFDREKVVGIVLQYPSTRIELAKKDGTWRITAPTDLDADQGVVTSLVASVADAELKKTVEEEPASLAPFGLDEPTAIVSLTLEDGTELPALAIGKTTPVGYSAYARRGDEKGVLLTTSAFHSGVKKELKDLRDKTVLPFQEDAVQEIRIQSEGEPETVLHKDGDGWSLTKPVAAKADLTQVRSFLSTLRSMRALDFVDEKQSPPDARYGLAPPRSTVTLLVGEDRAERRLLVGGASTDASKKEIYVERGKGGPIFTVGDHLGPSLAKKPVDFRDKTIVSFDKEKLASVVLTDATGNSFTLQKRDGKWTVADLSDGTAKDLIIERFVDDLRTLKGADIVAEGGRLGDFDLDEPVVKIELGAADGTSLGTILAAQRGTGAEKKIFAAAAGAKTIYTLNDYVFQRIDKRRADFVEPVVATPRAEATPAG
jgi:Domain of unknown function (DUF4340)